MAWFGLIGKKDLDDVNKKFQSAFSKLRSEKKQQELINEQAKEERQENKTEIKRFSEKVISLEAILDADKPTKPISRTISRTRKPTKQVNRLDEIKTNSHLDIDKFSEQEQRIFQTLLSHKEMSLSYEDLGKALSKSPNTIKNQVNKIRAKADVLDIVSENNKNRFKLKENIKISKLVD